MRIGSLIYATHSGLGVLSKEFYDNGVITDVLIKHHDKFTTHSEWYPEALVIGNKNFTDSNYDFQILEEFIKNLEILMIFESPWYAETISLARKYKVPVVLMPMYEWTPFPLDADLYITVSPLDYDYYKAMYPDKQVELLYVPTNSHVKWKMRERCKTFLHNAGNGSRNDRNGTVALIESLQFVKSPIKLKIKAQSLELPNVSDTRVEIINKDMNFTDLWDEADTFIFVERFAGLSLPLQEAFSAGMLVLAGDRYPINTWLPKSSLVKPSGYEDLSFVNVPFKSAIYDPKNIASMIDRFYDTDISTYSLAGKYFSEARSWPNAKPAYISLFKSLLSLS